MPHTFTALVKVNRSSPLHGLEHTRRNFMIDFQNHVHLVPAIGESNRTVWVNSLVLVLPE